MNHRRDQCLLLFWSIRICFSLVAFLIIAYPALAQEAGEIVSILGTAEVSRTGTWQSVAAGQTIKAGDVVRTGPGSRVALQLANGTQLKLNANSQLELKQLAPPLVRTSTQVLHNILRVLSGEFWFRTDEPLEIQTLPATATIRGTEFNLTVGPSDSARLAVLQGLVEFHNPQGSVLVAAGEQATAIVGEAPRKTVLVNPLDAVQWSLYYPGIVSYRDYPLTGMDPSRLQKQFTTLQSRLAASPRDANALVELGEVSFDLGRRTEARTAFTQALSLEPRNARALTGLGWVYLETGEIEAALGQFRQVQTPSLMTWVGMANALYRLDRFEEAGRAIAVAKERFPSSPMLWTQAALNGLIQGRVPEALRALDKALALDPQYALAYGLRSNIYLVQNDKMRALEAAQQAVAANPSSPTAYLDMSLVKQAEFQLEEALQAARRAVELDPNDPQALIQESRLLFGMGRTKEAFKVAEKARQLAPQDALGNSTLGFLQLARYKMNEAIAAFERAIAQDSTLGEPHLGLGIALFEQNKTTDAVEEMQKATLLEPKVSLYQSYLGKAYYEIKQNQLAQKHLALAKQLDPRDPTPYFYDAIRLQSVNRPMEAVQDLQKSIDLNNDRAVYRSRLLLDEDLAARDAALGKIYNEVGFAQLGLNEGSKSLISDPANYSAHRLLADSYSALPRHEIARVSELLQSQLLQPINVTPVQPQLAETNLLFLAGAGPTTPSLNEFNPLFVRDRLMLLASGIAGNNNTLGDEVVLSGIEDSFSYSLGQFHYETDGFRKNNDLKQDIYNLFIQGNLSPTMSLQAEARHGEVEHGDLRLNFDLDTFDPFRRRDLQTDTVRLGAHYAPTPNSDVIASVIYQEETEEQILGANFNANFESQGYIAEAQYILRMPLFNVVTGASYYDAKNKINLLGEFDKFDISQSNGYLYFYLHYPAQFLWTLGISTDASDNGSLGNLYEVNPKLGFLWSLTPDTTLRFAAFRMLKRSLLTDQTIEPTQVAGFNQLFDDPAGTDFRRYGIALEHKFSSNVYGGAEVSKRDLNVPVVNAASEVWKEEFFQAYVYWTLNKRFVTSAEYEFERYENEDNFYPPDTRTHLTTLALRYFHPSGFFSRLGTTYVDQFVTFDDNKPTENKRHDGFLLVDAGIGYHLPKRYGVVQIGVNNLFNENFNYQGLGLRKLHPELQQSFFPERTVFAQINFNLD